jgi:putative lipoprotein
LIYSVASSILIGTLKEIADSREKGNRFDTRDLLATTYGGLSIGVTFNIFTKKKP